MNVLVTGSSGLVGSALCAKLQSSGFRVIRLVRSRKAADSCESSVFWDPYQERLDLAKLGDISAVVHLSGAGVAASRWSRARKDELRASRVQTTKFLCAALADLRQKPEVLVCASALGFYGDRGEEWLDESSSAGEGFLPSLCKEWELATQKAANDGIRVVNLRIGLVLSQKGGVLQRMLTPFRLGFGGKLGSGKQFMSWIVLEDLLASIIYSIKEKNLAGIVNAVAPTPVTNLEFTKTIGEIIQRPTFCAVPACLLHLLLGEMADELMLASARIKPAKLLQHNFSFEYAKLQDGLKFLLSKV